jgi:hypothetical protein
MPKEWQKNHSNNLHGTVVEVLLWISQHIDVCWLHGRHPILPKYWHAKQMSEERLADGLKQLDCFCEGLPSVDFSTLSFCFNSIKCQFPEIWFANPETTNIWVAEDFSGLRECISLDSRLTCFRKRSPHGNVDANKCRH